MDKEYLELAPALKYMAGKGIHRTRETLVGWCKRHGIGHQTGSTKWGTWLVDVKKLDAFLAGEKSDG